VSEEALDREGAAEQLRAIVERVKRLREERSVITGEIRDVLKEAKSSGFDAPTITQVVIRAEKDPKAVFEADALLETYEQALGSGAAALGILQAKRGADGVFKIEMVSGPSPDAGEKLTRATKARREAVALAELARRARGQ
jgi:uncharacterized protein (UPF0335 family)